MPERIQRKLPDESLNKTITALALPAVRAQGLAIWGLELIETGRMLVRLFVCSPTELGNAAAEFSEDQQDQRLLSASVDQCEAISRQLSLALDAEELIDRAYTLEVSTPGFNRIFFSPAQMMPYIGDMVEARMKAAYAPDEKTPSRRVWKGLLTAVDTGGFTLAAAGVDDEGNVHKEDIPPVHLPFDAARRVNRVHIFSRPQKPGRGQKPGMAKKNSPAPEHKGKKE